MGPDVTLRQARHRLADGPIDQLAHPEDAATEPPELIVEDGPVGMGRRRAHAADAPPERLTIS